MNFRKFSKDLSALEKTGFPNDDDDDHDDERYEGQIVIVAMPITIAGR